MPSRTTRQLLAAALLGGSVASAAEPPRPAVMPPVAVAPKPAAKVEQSTHVRVTIIDLPADFADVLTKSHKDGSPLVLEPAAAERLRRVMEKVPGADVLSRPELLLLENQTGFFQVGQQYPIVAGTTTAPDGGTNTTFTYVNTGLTLRVTPRAKSDGAILLRAEFQHIEPAKTSVEVPGGLATAIDTQSVEMAVTVAAGHTAVLPTAVRKSSTGRSCTVLLITPSAFGDRFEETTAAVLRMEATPHIHMPLPTVAPVFPAPLPAAPVLNTPHGVQPVAVLPCPPAVVAPICSPICKPAEVTTEVQVVTVPTGFAQQTGFAVRLPAADGVTFLSADECRTVLTAAEKHPGGCIMKAPRVTGDSGQAADLLIGDAMRMTICPEVSADRRFTRMTVGGTLQMGVGGPLYVRQTAAIPDGRTMMLLAGTREPIPCEFGPPVVSQIPYLNRLFKNVRMKPAEDVFLMVTPKPCAAPAAVVPATAVVASPAAGLVAKYHAALAAGQKDEAVRLAVQALALDPHCFAR